MIENFLLDEELYISKNYINPNYLSYNDKINNDSDNNIHIRYKKYFNKLVNNDNLQNF